MKFEYINLLNEANDTWGWRDTIYLPNSISYKGYLLRFVRNETKVGNLIGTHFVRDCRTRVVNYSKPAKYHKVNVDSNGKVMAVTPSYALGYDFTYVVGEILRYFCTFNGGNKNKNYQFILKTLKVNDDRTISIQDRKIDKTTPVDELNKSDLFFVFDAKRQYRYGDGGLNIHAYPTQLIEDKGGRHTSNLLLTNDAKLKKYKICSLSGILNHINSKINREVLYKKGANIIKKDDFKNSFNSKNRTLSSNLIQNFIETFGEFNNYGTLSILSNYEKISWDEFDFLNNDMSEEAIRFYASEKSLEDLDKSEAKDIMDSFSDDENEFGVDFLGNRFSYIGKYPSNVNAHIENSNLSYKDTNMLSLMSNVNSMFAWFDFYAKFMPKNLEPKQKSSLTEMIDGLSGIIRNLYDANDLSKTVFSDDKKRTETVQYTDDEGNDYLEDQDFWVDDEGKRYTAEEIEKLEDKNEDEIKEKAKKYLKSFDTHLASITESFSLFKSLVLTSFKGSVDMVKDFFQLENGLIIEEVIKAKNNIEKGVELQKTTLQNIKDFVYGYINNPRKNISVFIKNYTFDKFEKSIEKFNENAFNYKDRVWFKEVDELKSLTDNKLPSFVGTSYNEPDESYAEYISIVDEINEIYEKWVTEENNKKAEELSNETENYLNKNDDNKSDKNDDNNEEKGDSSTPLNDSYIIRRGDRVYDSSYLHQIVKGRFNVSRNTTLNESNRKTKVLKHQWDQAYNFLNEAVDNLPTRRKFRY